MSVITHPESSVTLQPAALRALHAVVRTDDTVAPAIVRIALGLVMLPHGLQKTVGLFGGYGFEGTLGFLTGSVGLPAPLAALVIAIESVGAVLLVLGLGGRLMAAGIGAVMLGAVATMHVQHGFFMNWSGQQGGEGFEFHLLAGAMALAVVVAGSGSASIDRVIDRALGR